MSSAISSSSSPICGATFCSVANSSKGLAYVAAIGLGSVLAIEVVVSCQWSVVSWMRAGLYCPLSTDNCPLSSVLRHALKLFQTRVHEVALVVGVQVATQ